MRTRAALPVLTALLLGTVPPGETQDLPAIKPAPVVAGNGSFITTFQTGQQLLVPGVDPILLLPAGDRFLLEAEGEFEGDFLHQKNAWDNGRDTRIDYIQLDFIANRHLTVVVGRYLTPFGIFNERLHPPWIKYLQPNPLIYRLSALRNNGVMLRGASWVTSKVSLNYSGYFSALSTAGSFSSKRNAGGRVGLFLPRRRLELGGSVERVLQGQRFSIWGFDTTWQLERVPLDFHGEYARSKQGSGYWVEGAYWLSQLNLWPSLTRKSQAVARIEQFFAPGPGAPVAPIGGGTLPGVKTQRLTWGWNYYLNDALRFSFSYGREFRSLGDRNVWSLGIEYRFQFPAVASRQKTPAVSPGVGRPPRRSPQGDTTGSLARGKPKPEIDPDQAYRANCSRCHAKPRRLPDREMATIMRHMRVRANLTAEEAEAILRYLTR